MTLFKAYDIRGVVPDQLNEDIARRIGYFLVRHLGASSLVIGRDVRATSPAMSAAAAEGASRAGAAVSLIGDCTTPMVYFATGSLGLDAGLMTTASHNPPQYNGFKACGVDATPISLATGLADVRDRVFSDEEMTEIPGGSIQDVDIRDAYRQHILGAIGEVPAMHIVVDCANGAVGPIFDEIFSDSPLTVHRLFFEPDGTFPNHEPNPLEDKNIEDLSLAVRETGAQLGVAFDGDGDRCCLVDENGDRISNDVATALMAREILETHPGATIVYDLRSSRVVPEEVEKYGGTAVRERVGHSFIKKTMRDHHAPFGGELSGHYYFKEHYYCDSALFAFVRFLRSFSSAGVPASELLAPLRRYPSTGEVNFEVEDKDGAIEQLAQRYADGDQDRLDGITIRYPEWWLNVRKSNTEPLLRLNLEADSSALMNAKLEEVSELLNAVQ
jgi:phosphomannomutase